MGVECAQHSFERGVDQLLVRKFVAIDVLVAHTVEHHGKQFEIRVSFILFGGLDRAEINADARNQIQSKDHQQSAIEQTSFHKTLR